VCSNHFLCLCEILYASVCVCVGGGGGGEEEEGGGGGREDEKKKKRDSVFM